MPAPERIYGGAVRALSVAFIAIGVAMIGTTLGAGGGPASVGLLMGVGFIAVGAARLWLTGRDRS